MGRTLCSVIEQGGQIVFSQGRERRGSNSLHKDFNIDWLSHIFYIKFQTGPKVFQGGEFHSHCVPTKSASNA